MAGVFATGPNRAISTHDSLRASDPYLHEDDLDGLHPKGMSGTTKGLIAVIALLVLGLGAVVLTQTEVGKNVMLVFQGDYRAQKQKEKEAKEEAFKQAQLDALERYGTLTVDGSPLYASIKLDGTHQYGQTSSGEWREVQLKPGISNFSNLSIKEPHTRGGLGAGLRADEGRDHRGDVGRDRARTRRATASRSRPR